MTDTRGEKETEGLDATIVDEIMDYLSRRDFGGSASDISRALDRNRITVSKYLEVMQSRGMLRSMRVAQARLWEISPEYARPTVMVVDDDKHILELVKLSLVHKNFHLIEARDGVEALEKIRLQKPDLVILDLMMPRLDGNEVCRILRQSPQTEDIPLIMLTAKTQVVDKIEGFRLGADDYVTKPFNPLELEARVDALMHRTNTAMKLNPITGLPGYDLLMEKLANTKAKIIVIDINNFRAYNGQYGFQRGNDVLRMISRIVKVAVREHGSPEDFVAHISSDDFIVLTYANADNVLGAIQDALEQHQESISPDQTLQFSFATIDSLDVVEEIRGGDVTALLSKIQRH